MGSQIQFYNRKILMLAEKLMKSGYKDYIVNCTAPVLISQLLFFLNFSVLITEPRVMHSVNIRRNWVKVTGNTLNYFWKFSRSLILSQNKKLRKYYFYAHECDFATLVLWIFVDTLRISDQEELSRLKMDKATGQMFSQMTWSKEMCQMFSNSSTYGGTYTQ